MSREFASPELGNLIASRLSPERFDARVNAPLTDGEKEDAAALFDWFTRRYPTAQDRLAYARRKVRQYARATATDAVAGADYLSVAKRLADAHRRNDPETVAVFLAPDPERKEIRLLEITRSAPATGGEPVAVGFMARPDLGFPFPSSILLLSPEEWGRVKSGLSMLEDGWSLGSLLAL